MKRQVDIPTTADGESHYTRSWFKFTPVIISFVLIGIVVVNPNLKALTTTLLFGLAYLFVLSKIISKVHFNEKNIEVVHYLGNKKTIEYTQITKCFANTPEIEMTFVYVLKYKKNNKVNKITFFIENLDFSHFKKQLFDKKRYTTQV